MKGLEPPYLPRYGLCAVLPRRRLCCSTLLEQGVFRPTLSKAPPSELTEGKTDLCELALETHARRH